MGLNPEDKPRLRNLEHVALSVEGRPVIGLRDPLDVNDKMLVIDQQALYLVAMFDGEHSLRDIQVELSRRAGTIVLLDDITKFADSLDQACLLEGPRFQEAYRRKAEDFRNNSFRPCSHAGTSYPEDPEELRSELESYFTQAEGPGLPEFFSRQQRVKGLIVPHIDIRAGGRCFAQGYHALASGQPSDLYIIFGTGHAGVSDLFASTGLDFQTPLGITPTDREFIDDLSRELGKDTSAEEILHAREHVIEFQVLFLQYLFAERHPFKIVPIVCSLSPLFFQEPDLFEEQKQSFHEFCTAVKELCHRRSQSVCFLASSDFAHIGPRYGDPFIPHEGTVSQCLDEDRKLLSALESLDIDGFIGRVARDNDPRRICGFSPITAMFHCMEASDGTMISLDYAEVDDKNSFVSFASMAFH